jgi:NAD+ synthase
MFNINVLDIIPEKETDRIVSFIQTQVFEKLKRRGLIVAISGGIDSSVTAALAVRALGKDRVLTLALPENESGGDSMRLGKMLAEHLGTEFIVEDISSALEAFGCYQRRDEAVRRIFPQYDSTYKMKIVQPQNLLESGRISFFYLVIENPGGRQFNKRLPARELLEIVAATNHKQRTRKQFEYYHADRMMYAVAGTPNRLEYDQGFFVKGGDGLADVKPIAHLYKTQVYALARYLDIPEEIQSQTPSTDTYSLSQTQEEFYFALSYDKLDLMLWAYNHNIPAQKAGTVMGFTEQQVEHVYRDIAQKRRTTEYLHYGPLLVEQIFQKSTE